MISIKYIAYNLPTQSRKREMLNYNPPEKHLKVISDRGKGNKGCYKTRHQTAPRLINEWSLNEKRCRRQAFSVLLGGFFYHYLCMLLQRCFSPCTQYTEVYLVSDWLLIIANALATLLLSCQTLQRSLICTLSSWKKVSTTAINVLCCKETRREGDSPNWWFKSVESVRKCEPLAGENHRGLSDETTQCVYLETRLFVWV